MDDDSARRARHRSPQGWIRRWPVMASAIVAALVLTMVAFLGGLPPILRLPAQLLCVCEAPADASYEAIVIMMGEVEGRRVEAAAEYFRRGVAKRVNIVQPESSLYEDYGVLRGQAFLARDLAVRLGVPEDRIHIIYGKDMGRATSSFEEARYHLAYLQAGAPYSGTEPRKILLVTDWFHTSRARWIFRRVFAGSGIDVDAAAARPEWVAKWWTDEYAFIGVFNEYLKWTYYLLKYGLPKPDERPSPAGPPVPGSAR